MTLASRVGVDAVADQVAEPDVVLGADQIVDEASTGRRTGIVEERRDVEHRERVHGVDGLRAGAAGCAGSLGRFGATGVWRRMGSADLAAAGGCRSPTGDRSRLAASDRARCTTPTPGPRSSRRPGSTRLTPTAPGDPPAMP